MKKTICLDVEQARRLGSFASHHGLTESAVVAAALEVRMEGYRSYTVEPKSRPAEAAGEAA